MLQGSPSWEISGAAQAFTLVSHQLYSRRLQRMSPVLAQVSPTPGSGRQVSVSDVSQ